MSEASELILGPALLGLCFNLILYGITLTQVYIYFTTYKRDYLRFKIFIFILLLADTMNSVFDLVFIYDRLVVQFGNEVAAGQSTWVFGMGPFTIGIVALMVQLFFAWRIRVLTKNVWMFAVISILAVVTFLSAVAILVTTIVGFAGQFQNAQKDVPIAAVWLSTSVLTDTFITIFLTLHLRRHRTGFSTTDDTVNRIIRLTVQTGMVTTIICICDLAVFLSTTSTGYHLIFNLPLAKLYTNSILSSLNSRQGWQYGSSMDGTPVTPTSRRNTADPVGYQRNRAAELLSFTSARSHVVPEVYVDVEAHEMVDGPTSKPGLSESVEGSPSKPARAL